MAAKLGHKKAGGRKKGTPNKKTQDVADKLAALGCDPLTAMATIAQTAMDDGDTQLALTAFKELAQYIAPKRKALEVKADININKHDEWQTLNNKHEKRLKQTSHSMPKNA